MGADHLVSCTPSKDGVKRPSIHSKARNFCRRLGPVRAALAAAVLTSITAISVQTQAAEPSAGGGLIAGILQKRLAELASVFAAQDPQSSASAVSERYAMGGHEASDGPRLSADIGEHLAANFSPERCPAGADIKSYDIAAVATRIYMNRYGDNDPEGRLYTAIENVDAVIALGQASPDDGFGVSLGQGADLIQPLTLRVNVGDCLRISLTNLLEAATSFHVHGADLIVAATGQPALSTNPDAIALPGTNVAYEWYVDPAYYSENTHYAHPHGPSARFQVTHGLFGAVIVEPQGSEYLDPRSGEPLCEKIDATGVMACRNSWDAVISPGEGADFREFAMFYHEVGNENFNASDRNGEELPAIEPITVTYKPAGRAINYRSEPFSNRLVDQDAAHQSFYGRFQPDVALAYSSYTFGDPTTPIPQSYLGDPVKFRLIHGGSETFHVPHLHGGGVQWQRQPDMGVGEDNYVPLNAGLTKQFAASMPSSSTDSQSMGPSETYDLEIGCGSGGCQQSVGDFLFHCHIASHYIAGMWNYWRVYNTLQDADGKTDDLPVVIELPDRQGQFERAATSEELIGKTVAFSGETVSVDETTLALLIETQLPPQGQRRDVQDAQVFDWVRQGNLYLNEPDTEFVWVNYRSDHPGERPPLKFATNTGRLAWPFLQPHLGLRPPFAPYHGPAPYLEPLGHINNEPALPGANGPSSLCPEGAPRRFFKIHAIQLEIDISKRDDLKTGMLYVLKEDEARVRATQDLKVPLAIRANQGDCVDIVLVNEITGLKSRTRPLPNVDKANIHIHFLQFDVQGSDGVPTGGAFEQAPRPFAKNGLATGLQSDAGPGTSRLLVGSGSLFHPGTVVAVGIDQNSDVFETVRIAAIEGDELILDAPLQNAHAAGELVSAEFVRYRWYVARQNGAVYFHDHVDALRRWGRGLFGALIAEPRGATFHDPRSGEEIRSGTMADIHAPGEVVPGLNGSFREFVVFLADRTPQDLITINMRTEPLVQSTRALRSSRRRTGPVTRVFSSDPHGEPFTPIFEAYAGDPVMMRVLTAATEDIHSFIVTGHQFRTERFQLDSPLTNSVNVGISERFNAYIEAAGGPMGRPGDYLYYSGVGRHLEAGAWGLMRVHGGQTDRLRPLPGHVPPSQGPAQLSAGEAGNPCPASAPRRHYDVDVVPVAIGVHSGRTFDNPEIIIGKRYILRGDPVKSDADADPLVLRANAGDCLEINLANRTNGVASLNIEGANFDPRGSFGGMIGRNPDSSTRPGEAKDYRFFLNGELGALRMRGYANPFANLNGDLYGALIVEPAGATYHDPLTNTNLESGVAALIRLPDGSFFREFVTLFADQDHRFGRFVMPYFEVVQGEVAVNFNRAPFERRLRRLGRRPDDPRKARLFDEELHGLPATGVFLAEAGDQIRFRVIGADTEQIPVFSVEGHDWALTPGLAGSDIVSSRLVPASGAMTFELRRAGGPAGRAGDYLWSNHRLPYMEAGQWGLLRVVPPVTNRALGPRRGATLYTQLKL